MEVLVKTITKSNLLCHVLLVNIYLIRENKMCNRLWASGPAHILVLHIIGFKLTFFTCIAHILVLHTMICTAHYASYIKALMYILYFITVKYNTIHSIFPTWNQRRMNISRGMMSYILSYLTVIITSPGWSISFSTNNTLNMISIYFTF